MPPHPTTGYERRRGLYSGHVQGVGFRATALSIAGRHPVTGYVRNLPDGRVELLAEGRLGDLDALLADVAETMRDYIREVRTEASPATGEFQGFKIRH